MNTTREDFFRSIQTQEDGRSVGVSYSDSLEGLDSCLLQVGSEGDFTCAYLSDQQARELRDALDAYLAAPTEDA
jgi:hypothetical protein